MISQESMYTDTALSDFSTALLRANKKENLSEPALARSTATVNANLSSVLSQIQDDGPAYADRLKPENVVNLTTNNDRNKTNSINQSHPEFNNNGFNQKAIDDYSANDLLRKAILSAEDAEEKTKNRIWPQMVVMLFVAAVSVASLFIIYTKTNDMQATLNLYDARIKNSEATQNIEPSPEISSISQILKSMQQQIQLIKTESPILADNKSPSQTDETVAKDENVSMLKDEILALKSELKTVNSKLKAVDVDDALSKKIITTKLEGWVVNLASFTNRISAQKKVVQLTAAGLTASLQQAMVNEGLVYRLSVGGFKSRSEAELFIREAGNKYGMKDGWIRKS